MTAPSMSLAAKAFTLIRLALSGKESPARAIYEASLSRGKPTPVDAKVIIAVVVFMPLLLLSLAVIDASPESARALSPLAGLRCMADAWIIFKAWAEAAPRPMPSSRRPPWSAESGARPLGSMIP